MPINLTIEVAYCDVARRSLSASKLLEDLLPEASCFLCYHAFESAGGALSGSLGKTYPRGHDKKLNMLMASSASLGVSVKIRVAQLVIELKALRNLCLYPNYTASGLVKLPKDLLTAKQAQRLRVRVDSVVTSIAHFISR